MSAIDGQIGRLIVGLGLGESLNGFVRLGEDPPFSLI